MPSYTKSRKPLQRFGLVLASFLQGRGLPFAGVLSEKDIEQAFDDESVRFGDDEDAVYTPAVTLWAFLSQVLFKGEHRSCTAAVARVVVLLVALKRDPCSFNTGAYCRARSKLPEDGIRRLAVAVAQRCESQVDESWLWRGRRVRLADGSTISMPDTARNQDLYPQSRSQKEGLGFPIARIVVLQSLATGMLLDMSMGPYAGKETGETALLRSMLGGFQPGDILLADRCFCSYFMIALLMELDVDFVTRIHQRRLVDFQSGRSLGKNDHIVEWERPQQPPWMDDETYDRMPSSIKVRELEVHTHQPGCRTPSLVVVTTMTDAGEFTKADLAELYGRRWSVELDIRAIKVTMGMDVLRCKSPEMVHREVWACLLAYNLIRQTILRSARERGVPPRQLSMAAALQSIGASWVTIASCEASVAENLVNVIGTNLTGCIVGRRPGRIEPRAVKRRPKEQRYLTKPREEARRELIEKNPGR